MKKKYTLYISLLFLFVSVSTLSQTVTIDIQQQRFLGNVSSLDRSKFFNIHDANGDEVSTAFLQENRVGFGRRFFGPFADRSFVNPIGNFPTTPVTPDGALRQVRRFIATANPKSVWRPGYDTETASDAAVRYFMNEVNTANRPEYWEPFNEPFIKAFDPIFTSGGNSPSQVITEMSIWFREMAKKIHDTPELGKMKVIGFSDAFPSFERRGFTNWRDREKKFIDLAGAEMDAISVHPYDGVNVTGQANGRSGSNSEAILDLIETYTALKFGTPKKLAITEFGVIEDNSLYPETFSDSESALTIRGLNSMLFNFLEREDNIEISIPFITGRADFWYNNDDAIPTKPYIPALVVPTALRTTRNPNPPNLYRSNDLVLAWKANFYRLWKNVEGERAMVSSDDLDIQAQLFVKGSKAYLILNNLDEADRDVNLNFISGGTNIDNVLVKSVVVNGTQNPIYDNGTSSSAMPGTVSLKNGETKVFEITYSNPVAFTKTIVRERYFGNPVGVSLDAEFAPVLKASANTEHVFNFSDVDLGDINDGKAVLRLGVGVPQTVEFNPNQGANEGLDIIPTEVKVNGTPITLPTNWKGYDQSDRIEFFGLLEMNVPYSLLNAGNNSVSIKYAKTDGLSNVALGNSRFEKAKVTIASVVLGVERKSNDLCTKVTLYADEDGDGLGNPDVSILQCPPVAGYVENANDTCPNDVENVCAGFPIPGTVEAEAFTNGTGSGVQLTSGDTFIGFINNGDATEYDINVLENGIYNMRFLAAADNDAGGDITIFANSNEVGSLTVTGTGSFRTTNPFDTSVTLNQGQQTLRLEYSGTGNGGGFLFDIDKVVVSLTTSLSVDEFNKDEFKIISNPIENVLKFSSDKGNGEDYKIYQINGSLVTSGKYSSGINVSNLATGVYIINIKNSSLKFIKQ